MTPYEFGQKLAADAAALAPAKQPMEKAITTTAKNVPSMLNVARAHNKPVINIMNPISNQIHARTGRHPTHWELHEVLADGLPYPYPAPSPAK